MCRDAFDVHFLTASLQCQFNDSIGPNHPPILSLRLSCVHDIRLLLLTSFITYPSPNLAV